LVSESLWIDNLAGPWQLWEVTGVYVYLVSWLCWCGVFCKGSCPFFLLNITVHGSPACSREKKQYGILHQNGLEVFPYTRSRCVQLWMMLFEIMPGRRNSDLMENGTIRYLPVWATIGISEGDIYEILDHRLNNVNF
jgi:hypothetical protein